MITQSKPIIHGTFSLILFLAVALSSFRCPSCLVSAELTTFTHDAVPFHNDASLQTRTRFMKSHHNTTETIETKNSTIEDEDTSDVEEVEDSNSTLLDEGKDDEENVIDAETARVFFNETDTDIDIDKDKDVDTDEDSDADADADADKDSDADADADADADTDEDSDADTDADKDSDADTDEDNNNDTDSNTDTDGVTAEVFFNDTIDVDSGRPFFNVTDEDDTETLESSSGIRSVNDTGILPNQTDMEDMDKQSNETDIEDVDVVDFSNETDIEDMEEPSQSADTESNLSNVTDNDTTDTAPSNTTDDTDADNESEASSDEEDSDADTTNSNSSTIAPTVSPTMAPTKEKIHHHTSTTLAPTHHKGGGNHHPSSNHHDNPSMTRPPFSGETRPTRPSNHMSETSGANTASSNLDGKVEIDEGAMKKAFGALFGGVILLMIFTAYQMKENPHGLCAGICNLSMMVVTLVFKVVCLPCRFVCNRNYHGHEEIAVNRMIYSDQALHNDLTLELT